MVLTGVSTLDIFLSMLYTILILLIAYNIKKRLSKNKYNNNFIPFVLFKIACSVFFALIHIYYYKGGDTFLFFAGGKFIATQVLENPDNFFKIFFSDRLDLESVLYTNEYYIVHAFKNESTYFTCKLVSIFTLVAFNQFIATTIVFSVFFGIGIWTLYSLFCQLYPSLYKIFGICVLYFPTIGIWGSGILKDPVTFGALGLIYYCVFSLIKRKNITLSILFILVSLYACLQLKPYILYIFIPSVLLWLQSYISSGLTNPVLRYLVTPVLIIIFSAGGYFFLQGISSEAGKYSLENVESVAVGFQNWHSYLSETRDQSGYSLGEVDFSMTGLLQKSPEALFVTYYRPRIDEIRNVATALGGIEANIILLMTLFIFFRVGIFKVLQIAISDKNVRAFLFFALFFGIALGFTSYNFGALSRYKIPSLPFFTCSLAIIYHIGTSRKRAKQEAIFRSGVSKSPKNAFQK